MCVSQKLVFHQSICITAIKRILSTSAMYVSSSSYMYLCIPCYCDARLKSSALRVGVKTLHNAMQMHGASNRDTHLYSSHNNSSVYLTITTYVRRTERITDGMRIWRTNPQDSAFSSPTPAPNSPEWPSQEQRGSSLTASDVSRSYLYKWGMASSATCECGAEEQTVDHVVLQCPIHRPPHGLHGLTVLDNETIEWLLNTCPEI